MDRGYTSQVTRSMPSHPADVDAVEQACKGPQLVGREDHWPGTWMLPVDHAVPPALHCEPKVMLPPSPRMRPPTESASSVLLFAPLAIQRRASAPAMLQLSSMSSKRERVASPAVPHATPSPSTSKPLAKKERLPARMLTPYQKFCHEMRPLLPNTLRNAQRETALSQMWKALSEPEKAKYKVGFVKFTSPFLVFCKEQRPLLQPGLRNADREKLLGVKWKALSEAQKAEYKETLAPGLLDHLLEPEARGPLDRAPAPSAGQRLPARRRPPPAPPPAPPPFVGYQIAPLARAAAPANDPVPPLAAPILTRVSSLEGFISSLGDWSVRGAAAAAPDEQQSDVWNVYAASLKPAAVGSPPGASATPAAATPAAATPAAATPAAATPAAATPRPTTPAMPAPASPPASPPLAPPAPPAPLAHPLSTPAVPSPAAATPIPAAEAELESALGALAPTTLAAAAFPTSTSPASTTLENMLAQALSQMTGEEAVDALCNEQL